jgi:hypothetical protein
VLVLDERHQVHVILALDDEDALASVPVGVRMFQDVEQVATLDVEDDVLEPDVAIRLSFAFFASSQAKYFTAIRVAQRVLDRHTLASSLVCPAVCPNAVQERSFGSQRQPAFQQKTGLKSSISGPFWNRH